MTPLGEMSVDEELAEAILSAAPEIEDNPSAVGSEHSIEVQLPFLQRVLSLRRFVPVVIGSTTPEVLMEFGQALARAIRQINRRTIILISTNLTRLEPVERVQEKDKKTIERIVALDETGLLQSVEREDLSMCGAAAAAAGITAAKSLGATEARLTNYFNNKTTAGTDLPVSGYAGILIR